MKKSLTVLLLFVSGWCVGQTNVYHPFPDSNAVWNVYTGQSCGWVFDMFEVKYSYVLTEDTVINDTVYHKLDIQVVLLTLPLVVFIIIMVVMIMMHFLQNSILQVIVFGLLIMVAVELI